MCEPLSPNLNNITSVNLNESSALVQDFFEWTWTKNLSDDRWQARVTWRKVFTFTSFYICVWLSFKCIARFPQKMRKVNEYLLPFEISIYILYPCVFAIPTDFIKISATRCDAQRWAELEQSNSFYLTM